MPLTVQETEKETIYADKDGRSVWSNKAQQLAFKALQFTYNEDEIKRSQKFPLLKRKAKTAPANLAALQAIGTCT